ncbi:acid protease [Suillus decipiens]|nr:acid protease [Suillus decipiens]
MFPAALLTLLLVLSTTLLPVKAANSPVTVPITSRLEFSNGTNSLVAQDRARLRTLMDRNKHGQRFIVTNEPLVNSYARYSMLVDIGDPPTTYNLILDSGSANTWVRASVYQKTTGISTGEPVAVTYGSGFFSGFEYIDTVNVGPGLTVDQQSICVADESAGVGDFDGIIGIGPVALTLESLKEMPKEPIPTVTNNLHSQNIIPADILGIFFQPYRNSLQASIGQITFGGTDSTLYTGNIAYTSITDTEPASDYWGIDQSIRYGTTEILRTTAGIVDCGTTLLAIATEAFNLYKAATGSEYDPATELLVIPLDQYDALQELHFIIGDQTYTLTRNAQIWPRSLNTKMSGDAGSIYLIVRDIGTAVGEGDYDFVNGYVFMQRFYTVFDATNSRVGFATTLYTQATLN